MKEKNMEHFRSEIEEMLNNSGCTILAVVNGKPAECGDTFCEDCDLYKCENSCALGFIKWLMSEYKPEPVLTAKEKHFVEFAQKGWLTRTEDEKLMWHQDKPRKSNIMWHCQANQFCLCGFAHTFPFITWEDEEPWSVEELRKLKVK